MKNAVTVTISVTIYTDKDKGLVEASVKRGVLRQLDTDRLAEPINVKLEIQA